MRDPASREDMVPEGSVGGILYKRDFWREENLKYSRPHYRLEKSARIINRLTRGSKCTLLDVGCGPAALMTRLRPDIRYYGIDIAIHESAPNLIEADLLETPIKLGDKRFDIIIAQGFFEYVKDFQDRKFAEIADLLNDSGIFIVTYVNFAHRDRRIYQPYSNVQPIDDFRQSLAHHFKIEKSFPTSHNWHHLEPNRRFVRAVNMPINANIPFVSKALAVEYMFICSQRHPSAPPATVAVGSNPPPEDGGAALPKLSDLRDFNRIRWGVAARLKRPLEKWGKAHELRFAYTSRQAVFTDAYSSASWGSQESGSGTGF